MKFNPLGSSGFMHGGGGGGAHVVDSAMGAAMTPETQSPKSGGKSRREEGEVLPK